jgi:hypothetical protein
MPSRVTPIPAAHRTVTLYLAIRNGAKAMSSRNSAGRHRTLWAGRP